MAIAIPSKAEAAGRRRSLKRQLPATIALLPAAFVVIVVYLGCMLWTVRLSFTSSKLLPKLDFVGFAQYERLFSNTRFLSLPGKTWLSSAAFSLPDVWCLVFSWPCSSISACGPKACSAPSISIPMPCPSSSPPCLAVFLNPTFGLQKIGQDLGFESFTFDWLVNRDMAIYTIVIAGIWQSAGLVMAILLAGLRGVDNEIYKAARVDGIPTWRYYLSIVLPIIKPMVITATVLLAIAVVKVYDLVVAMTEGGPGRATEVPAKFVMDHLFERQNVGLATACATFMLVTVIAVLTPWLYAQYGPNGREARK